MAENIQVTSAPQAKPMTPEERNQRVKFLRERMGRSQIEVIPPAGKIGYWAHTTDTRELGRLDWVGFKIVREVDPKKPIWKANGLQPDGTYIVGDVILMEVDELTYEILQQEYIDQSEAQRSNAPVVFQSEADAKGIPTFEVAAKGRPVQQRR